MARTKTILSIDSDITKKQEMPAQAESRYDSLAKELNALMEEKREIQSQEILTACIKSGKSYSKIMNFLDFQGK